MEGNRDEALKCYHLAVKFQSVGNQEKALKFLHKSIKLYSTPKATALLEKLQSETESNGTAGNSEHVRKRRRTNSGHRNQNDNTEENEEPKEANYTQDQVQAVLRIKNCKDYYEVLGVKKDCKESDLKKSYRKLALQFHPDKNQAPGASEAFKRIGNAYSVLSDSDKRHRYEQFGENLGPSTMRRNRQYYEDEFEGDISPEDLFNMFFGGGFPNGRVHVRRGGRNNTRTYYNVHEHQQNQQTTSSVYPIVQILPVLLIVMFSLLSSFLIPEPIYSFQQTSQYRYPFTTQRYRIQYFVKDRDIRQKYNDEQFESMEHKIEREFLETLQVRCYRERQYIAELNHQARMWGSQDLLEKARRYRTESCNRLKELTS